MKKLNELKNGKTKEEMDAESIALIERIGRNAAAWRERSNNDPEIIAARKLCAARKSSGDQADETI